MSEFSWNADGLKGKTVAEAKRRLLLRAVQIQSAAQDYLNARVYAMPPSPHYKRTMKLLKIGIEEAHEGAMLCVKIGPAVFYGKYVEDGTRRLTRAEKTAMAKEVKKMARKLEMGDFTNPPRPFMRPAFADVCQKIRDEGL